LGNPQEITIPRQRWPMPWRVIACGDKVWHVDAVAERQAHMHSWQLVLAFRSASDPLRGRCICKPYPVEASSKSSLFLQAERIPDAALSSFLADRIV